MPDSREAMSKDGAFVDGFLQSHTVALLLVLLVVVAAATVTIGTMIG